MVSDAFGLAVLGGHGLACVPVSTAEADAFHPLVRATDAWSRGHSEWADGVSAHWRSISPVRARARAPASCRYGT